ncbi:choice-of-anchor D domain-containing protein [Rubricoccus marinus]|uniref:choice-of-anchor D domain-containing protein n=1 Tax=Rubricoccus marinus TaxID=716817 RepID=UPI0015C5F9D6|nr:choice-of-anchor D domain-containing protein [Rubricoccus marinus]
MPAHKSGGSGATLAEDFDAVENGGLPEGWTQFEAGTGAAAAETWAVLPYSADDPSLGKAAGVFFEDVASGLAVDYLVTPQVSIVNGDRLRATLFELYAAEYGSTYEIRVSTSGNASAADFTDVIATFTEATLPTLAEGPTATTYDLSAYAGMDIYIAFVFSNDDGDAFVIDDVFVEQPPAGSVIALSSEAVDFGIVPVGSTATTTITVSNNGGADLVISSIDASGDGFAVDMTGTSMTVAPSASTTFEISYSPTAAGDEGGSVTIASNAASSPSTIALSGIAATAPDNDNIADATPISEDGTYSGSNILATLETDEPVPSCQSLQGASIFWAYTPGSDGTVTIDLSASDFDTILTFHQADGTEIDCNDDGGTGLTSLLSDVPVTAGTTYLIRVAGFGVTTAATGAVSFDLALTPVVANENAPNAEFALTAPQPNPASGASQVSLKVETSQSVNVVVYDLLGRAVATLHEGPLASGQETTFTVNTSSLQAGPYVIRAQGETFVSTQRLTVVR